MSGSVSVVSFLLEDFFAFFFFFLDAGSSTNSIRAISEASPSGKASL